MNRSSNRITPVIMMSSIFMSIIGITLAQWTQYNSYLSYNTKYTKTTSPTAYSYSDYFVLPSTTYTTANFITCTTPPTSYITLDKTSQAAQYFQLTSFASSGNDIYFVSFDLYFQGTWASESVTYTFATNTQTFLYTSPTTYPLTSGFCDSLQADIKTVNFSMTIIGQSGQHKFQTTNSNTGQVSIRNFFISYLRCFPSCQKCSGPNYNQCTSCYYGFPASGICPSCPSNKPFYMKYQGCRTICQFSQPRFANGFCQYFQRNSYIYTQFYPSNMAEINRWSLIYDPIHVDTTPTAFQHPNGYQFYGLFKYGSGVYRFVNELSYSYATYAIGIHIDIGLFNPIPEGCGIQFKLNNTYYGSISNISGLQTHRIQIYDQYPINSYLTYTDCYYYEMYLYVDIPPYPFLFSAVGNYTDATAAWSMKTLEISPGYCPSMCLLCEVSYRCTTCQGGYYLSRDYTCSSCSYPYQKLNSSNICVDFDDETPYSRFLIQEYMDMSADPNQYSYYTLISSSGTNFLKGSDIYFSIWNGCRIFGGQYIWAQAKLSRDHIITDPHYSVTIAFFIVYGPTFPADGQFIYTIDNGTPITTTSASYTSSLPVGKYSKTYNKILHSSTTTALNMQWECFGPNNEPINAFCGFYNYYIAVHYCQPYCLACTDQYTCTSWNSTYDSNIIKFSQAECQSNQYFNIEISQCVVCPLECLTCSSVTDCATCAPTYTKTKLGCTCTLHQYQDTNSCQECPLECNQCISGSYCVECLSVNNRVLSNGQCNCIDGYYPIVGNPVCFTCHKYCSTCTGPSNSDCVVCGSIFNIAQTGTTCDCPANTYYQELSKTCTSCHSSCLTCFRTTIDGCLTCDAAVSRTLKGLKCECQPGYYEVSSLCTQCPAFEDVTLTACYKQCASVLIWHTNGCGSCDTGYELINSECIPNCGDGIITGYEECEDNNLIVDDGCFNCKFQCPQICTTCNSSTTFPCADVCGDGFLTGLEECEDGNTLPYDGCFNCKFQCQQQCTKCILGKCYECATKGYYIDPTVTPWQCKVKCGDGLVIGDEQCDDQNVIDTDGCKDCKYFCRLGCSNCNTNTQICLSCASPGFYPQSYYCINKCGDGIVVTDPNGNFNEQCDDGNTTNLDGCSSSCTYQCQDIAICTTCTANICSACAQGYVLNSAMNRCDPVCGDGVQVTSEPCENSFILPYKGCLNCKPKCQKSCSYCSPTGLGCLICLKGYTRVDNLCYSICGNKIITADEECDDGNLLFYDGCHNCQFTCQYSCLNCIKGKCFECNDGYILQNYKCNSLCGDLIVVEAEECDDGNTIQYDGCHKCKYSCIQNCDLCIQGICQTCLPNYIFDQLNNICIENIDHSGEMDIPFPYCLEIIDNQCINCESGYFDDLTNQCIYIEDENSILLPVRDFTCCVNCSICLDGGCSLCDYGYYKNGEECRSMCGDRIIVEQEQCDDGNLNQIDDCSNCQFNCADYCLDCVSGICTSCKLGFYLEVVSNSCQSICGDGILADNELCDDGNDIQYDGCYKCVFDCIAHCQNCEMGKCISCEESYLFVPLDKTCQELESCDISIGMYYDAFTNTCVSKCGDGILAGNELCDDGNAIPYDGCNDCFYQCNKMCTICDKGQCNECQIGYELRDNNCNTICGDGIRLDKEECDDGNILARDGCSNCRIDPLFQCREDDNLLSKCFRCQDNCIEFKLENATVTCLQCDKGYFLKDNTCIPCSEKCTECTNTPNNCTTCSVEGCQVCVNLSGDYLDPINKACITKCGDGIKTINEQCDDGNLIDQDGCNQKCQIEKQFTCDANGCYVPPKKSVDFTYINSTTKNDFELTLDNLNITSLCRKLDLWIELFDKKEYNFTIEERGDPNNHSGCDIKFNFFKTIYESNLIHLIVPLVDNASRLLVEETREIVIQPRKVVYYNEAEKAQAQSVVSVSNNLTFLLQLIGPITILLGGFNFFWTILDILAWINNFYFLNVDYPLNVKLFFNQLQWGDVINIPDVFTLNSPDDPYYFEAPPKFTEKGVNPLFFNNIQLFCALIGLAVLAYFGSNLIVWIFDGIYFKVKAKEKTTSIFQMNQSIEIFHTKKNPVIYQSQKNPPYLINLIYKETLWYKTNFKAKLIQVIGLVFLDVCLACTLQLVYTGTENYFIVKLNIIVAAASLLIVVYTFRLSYFVSSSHELLLENEQFQTYYASLFEGINIKCSLARNYSFINLIRKALFMFLTVFFYEQPLIQTSTCCLACFLNIALIIYKNPFETKGTLIQTAIPDFCIFCIIFITVLLAMDDSSAIFTFDQKYFMGWVMLFFIALSILVQMVFLLYQFFLEIKGNLQKIVDCICKKSKK